MYGETNYMDKTTGVSCTKTKILQNYKMRAIMARCCNA